MACNHLSWTPISREAGPKKPRNIFESVSYILGVTIKEKIWDPLLKMLVEGKPYSKKIKDDVKESYSVVPKEAAGWASNPQRYCEAIELSEKRKDSRLGYSVIFPFQNELSYAENKKILNKFIKENFVDKHGLAVQVGIHLDDENNPHAHLIISTRRAGINGFEDKIKELEGKGYLKSLRQIWANEVNQVYKNKGINARLLQYSYEELGMKWAATKHEGYAARNQENKSGKVADIVELNRDINIHNFNLINNEPDEFIKYLSANYAWFSAADISNEVIKLAAQLKEKRPEYFQDKDITKEVNIRIEKAVKCKLAQELMIDSDNLHFKSLYHSNDINDFVKDNNQSILSAFNDKIKVTDKVKDIVNLTKITFQKFSNTKNKEEKNINAKDTSELSNIDSHPNNNFNNKLQEENIMGKYIVDKEELKRMIFLNPNMVSELREFDFKSYNGSTLISQTTQGLYSIYDKDDKGKVYLNNTGVLYDHKTQMKSEVIKYIAQTRGINEGKAIMELGEEFGLISSKRGVKSNEKSLKVLKEMLNESEDKQKAEKELRNKQIEVLKKINYGIYDILKSKSLPEDINNYLLNERKWSQDEIDFLCKKGAILGADDYIKLKDSLYNNSKKYNFNTKDFLEIKPLSLQSKDTHKLFIPFFNTKNEIIGYVARDITNKHENKYKNSKLLKLSTSFVNINELKKDNDILLVEGVFDALRLNYTKNREIMEGVVPLGLCGGNLSKERIEILKEKNVQNIYLGLDNDKAGVMFTINILKTLNEAELNRVKIITYPDGIKDFDEFLIKRDRKELKNLVDNAIFPEDFKEYVLENYKKYDIDYKDLINALDKLGLSNDIEKIAQNVNDVEAVDSSQVDMSMKENQELNQVIGSNNNNEEQPEENKSVKKVEVLPEDIESVINQPDFNDTYSQTIQEVVGKYNGVINGKDFNAIVGRVLKISNDEIKKQIREQIQKDSYVLLANEKGKVLIYKDVLERLSNKEIIEQTEKKLNIKVPFLNDNINKVRALHNARNENKSLNPSKAQLTRIETLSKEVVTELTLKYGVFTLAELEQVIRKSITLRESSQDYSKIIKKYLIDNNLIQEMPRKTLAGEELFVSQEYKNIESELINTFKEIATTKSLEIDVDRLTKKLEDIRIDGVYELAADQKQAIAHALTGNNISIIRGRAGAGKTTALKELSDMFYDRRINRSYGDYNKIIGLAPTGKLSSSLAAEGGFASYTIDKFLTDEALQDLKQGDLIILEEAGMVDVNHYKKILEIINNKKAKIILVGDQAQIQPINAGQVLPLFNELIGSADLNIIRRQKVDWMREASLNLSNNDFYEGIKAYDENGHLALNETLNDAKLDLVIDYVSDIVEGKAPFDNSVMLTFQNEDVRQLNEMARNYLLKAGIINNNRIIQYKDRKTDKNKTISLAINDRVMFTENNYNLGIRNGDIATVLNIEDDIITYNIKGKGIKKISLSRYDKIDYAYSATINKWQGESTHSVYGLLTSAFNAPLTYTMLTRHTDRIKIRADKQSFGIKSEEQIIDNIAKVVGRDAFKYTHQHFASTHEEMLAKSKEYSNVFRLQELEKEIKGLVQEASLNNNFNLYEETNLEFSKLAKEREELANDILKNYDAHRLFLQEANIKNKTRLLEMANIKEKQLWEKEINELKLINKYKVSNDVNEKIILADSLSRIRAKNPMFYIDNAGFDLINDMAIYANKILSSEELKDSYQYKFAALEIEKRFFGLNNISDTKLRKKTISLFDSIYKDYTGLNEVNEKIQKSADFINDLKRRIKELSFEIDLINKNESLKNNPDIMEKLKSSNEYLNSLKGDLAKQEDVHLKHTEKQAKLLDNLGRFSHVEDINQFKAIVEAVKEYEKTYEVTEKLLGKEAFENLIIENKEKIEKLKLTKIELEPEDKERLLNKLDGLRAYRNNVLESKKQGHEINIEEATNKMSDLIYLHSYSAKCLNNKELSSLNIMSYRKLNILFDKVEGIHQSEILKHEEISNEIQTSLKEYNDSQVIIDECNENIQVWNGKIIEHYKRHEVVDNKVNKLIEEIENKIPELFKKYPDTPDLLRNLDDDSIEETFKIRLKKSTKGLLAGIFNLNNKQAEEKIEFADSKINLIIDELYKKKSINREIKYANEEIALNNKHINKELEYLDKKGLTNKVSKLENRIKNLKLDESVKEVLNFKLKKATGQVVENIEPISMPKEKKIEIKEKVEFSM